MAEVAAQSLRSACDAVIAVVPPPHTSTQQRLHALLTQTGCELAVNENAECGIGHSLATGVRQLQCRFPQAGGCVIALADMPFIARATFMQVVQALRQGHVTVAPAFNQRRGHPVGFASALFSALTHLNSDEGARSVLQQHPPHLIEVTDAGIERDIDFPQENLS